MNFKNLNYNALVSRIQSKSILLGKFATAYFGIQTFDRKKYVADAKLTNDFKPVIDGVHITRYFLNNGSEFVNFKPTSIKSGGKKDVYEQTRIGVRQIGEVPVATIIPAGVYALNTIYNVFFTSETHYKLEFILAITSSRLLQWYWKQMFFDEKKTFPKVKKEALLSIPIPKINFADKTEKAMHDKMVALVEQMLETKKQLQAARMDKDKNFYQDRCNRLDGQIDELVYDLCELTPQEIKIVEGEM